MILAMIPHYGIFRVSLSVEVKLMVSVSKMLGFIFEMQLMQMNAELP